MNKRFFGAMFAIALIHAPIWGQDDFSLNVLQNSFSKLSPSLCIVNFTQEITDPRTGENRRNDGNCLGLIVKPEGLVLVYGHLSVENAQPVDLRVKIGRGASEKEYPAVALSKPDHVNIMLLRIQSDTPLQLPAVTFSHTPLRFGEPVAIFGLMGDSLDFQPGMMMDRVGAILEQPRTTYCLSGAIRLGYITGPVVNTRGEVVGVTGFDLSSSEGGDIYSRSGHPLVYQADLIQPYIDAPPTQAAAPADKEEAWLGVFTQPLKDEFAEYWGLEKSGGLIVSTVVPDSPAAKVGIQPGDIIKSFDGKPQQAKLDRDTINFTKLVRDTGPGKTVPVDLLRDGRPVHVEIALANRPRSSKDAGEYEENVFGLVVREITRDVRIALNIGEDVQGVIVRRVKPGSPAQLGKMRPGVIILALGDYPVTSIDDFEKALAKIREQKPAEVAIFARVGPATGFFRIKPRW